MPETKSKPVGPRIVDPVSVRDDWVLLLEQLVETVEAWVKSDWATRVIKKTMGDATLGDYDAPALLIQRDLVRILLEPITRFAPGADGVVDLYLMPAYDDIASLDRVNNEWNIHYAFPGAMAVAGIRNAEALPLTEANFRRVLDAISRHGA